VICECGADWTAVLDAIEGWTIERAAQLAERLSHCSAPPGAEQSYARGFQDGTANALELLAWQLRARGASVS